MVSKFFQKVLQVADAHSIAHSQSCCTAFWKLLLIIHAAALVKTLKYER